MNLMGYRKMKYVDAYLDVYGEHINYHTILFDYHKTEKEVIDEFCKLQKENSVSSWRTYNERVVYKYISK